MPFVRKPRDSPDLLVSPVASKGFCCIGWGLCFLTIESNTRFRLAKNVWVCLITSSANNASTIGSGSKCFGSAKHIWLLDLNPIPNPTSASESISSKSTCAAASFSSISWEAEATLAWLSFRRWGHSAFQWPSSPHRLQWVRAILFSSSSFPFEPPFLNPLGPKELDPFPDLLKPLIGQNPRLRLRSTMRPRASW